MKFDEDLAYRAVETRDARFDGQFILAVRTTGIYCRPACPARKPLRRNTSFFPTAAAAQAAGYRACRRCLPDAAPGSPEWNLRADTVGAAMRLIADGVVDREGIPGLAGRLGYSQRHLNRLLTAELGAAPLALARARRAHTARVLLTTTDLPISDIAFAAGFASLRQFNETIQEVFAIDPSGLRGRRRPLFTAGVLALRLPVRQPFDGDGLLAFLALRAVAGVESITGRTYSRTLRLPRGPAAVSLTMPPAGSTESVTAELYLTHPADLVPAAERCRRLLDADADPVGIDGLLSEDPALVPLVERTPGIRLPGAVDGPEILTRAILGQQISVAAARTAAARLTRLIGAELPADMSAATGLTHLFPTADELSGLSEGDIGGPRQRAITLLAACRDIAAGDLVLDSGRRSDELQQQLCERAGIGPWTAGYVAMRILGDPDVLLTGDLVLRQSAERLGFPHSAAELSLYALRWGPFRSYAGMHLWRAASVQHLKGSS